MITVTIIQHDGTQQEIDVNPGVSLMQAVVDNSVDGIIGECGGCCSCATCHCYIDPNWVDTVGAPDSLEQDMLGCVLEPKEESRLSCQVKLTEALDGLVVRLPESQY